MYGAPLVPPLFPVKTRSSSRNAFHYANAFHVFDVLHDVQQFHPAHKCTYDWVKTSA